MTWPEVREAVRSGCRTLILPLGATEQHGPHLPLATDTIRAEALAERLAARVPGSLVAPTLPFGCSDEHSGFAGLLGLDHETLAGVILSLARRASGWGIRRIVLLSAHGGNARALELAALYLGRELSHLEVWYPEELASIGEATARVGEKDGLSKRDLGLHAGESETSEMLSLRPDLVGEGSSGFTGDMEFVLERLYAGGLISVTKSGVLGDPTRAEAGRGSRYLDAAAAEISSRLPAHRSEPR